VTETNSRVELLSLDREEWAALGRDPATFAGGRKLQVGDQDDTLRQLGVGHAAFMARTGADSRWGSFLAVDAGSRTLVGTCAYKGPPDPDGAVEIAYFTFPPHEGRGYATQMAALLTDRAALPPPAVTVRAHTLPERNASARILEKLGFALLGQVVDPEDGPVWRWERAPGSSPF
jgi:ribosomal-protein-alanine N-acetyltransferase